MKASLQATLNLPKEKQVCSPVPPPTSSTLAVEMSSVQVKPESELLQIKQSQTAAMEEAPKSEV